MIITSKVLGCPQIPRVSSALFWLYLADIRYVGKDIILLWICEVLKNVKYDTGL